MEKNVLLQIEYDGTGFSGWQRQPGIRTVQGRVEAVLSGLLGQDVTVSGCSRTDAGVHAKAEMAVFRADVPMPCENLVKALNDRFSGRPENPSEDGDIRIVFAKEVPDGFDIRGQVAGKTYVYSIRNADAMPVFLRNYRYLVKGDLDVEAMRKAADHIVGTHDFDCFRAAGGNPVETTVRTVTSVEIRTSEAIDMNGAVSEGRDVFIEVSGDGFLYNMVRIIAGTLVEVGLGKRDPDEMKEIIESRDRTNAGHTAPPQGLCLEEVDLSVQ